MHVVRTLKLTKTIIFNPEALQRREILFT